MTLAYSTVIQDQIAFAVYGQAYTDIPAADKARIDGTSAASPPTAGVAKNAWDTVNQVGQWFALAGATAAPDAFARWMVWEAASILATTVRPDAAGEFRNQREQAIDATLDSFSLSAANASALGGQAFTYAGIRYFVLNHGARRKEASTNTGLRRRIFVPPDDVDSYISASINEIWNMAPWNFRKRFVTFTIPSSFTGTVTNDLTSPEVFDSFLSQRLYYSGTGQTGDPLRWVTADEMARLKAYYGTTTGKPVGFSTQATGSTIYWSLVPLPDQQYTLTGSVLIRTPVVATDSADTLPFAAFPAEFKPVLREYVLAKCMQAHGASDSERLMARAMDQVNTLLSVYADPGTPSHRFEIADQYHDVEGMTGCMEIGGML